MQFDRDLHIQPCKLGNNIDIHCIPICTYNKIDTIICFKCVLPSPRFEKKKKKMSRDMKFV